MKTSKIILILVGICFLLSVYFGNGDYKIDKTMDSLFMWLFGLSTIGGIYWAAYVEWLERDHAKLRFLKNKLDEKCSYREDGYKCNHEDRKSEHFCVINSNKIDYDKCPINWY